MECFTFAVPYIPGLSGDLIPHLGHLREGNPSISYFPKQMKQIHLSLANIESTVPYPAFCSCPKHCGKRCTLMAAIAMGVPRFRMRCWRHLLTVAQKCVPTGDQKCEGIVAAYDSTFVEIGGAFEANVETENFILYK